MLVLFSVGITSPLSRGDMDSLEASARATGVALEKEPLSIAMSTDRAVPVERATRKPSWSRKPLLALGAEIDGMADHLRRGHVSTPPAAIDAGRGPVTESSAMVEQMRLDVPGQNNGVMHLPVTAPCLLTPRARAPQMHLTRLSTRR